jgi:hypothetical protein
MTSSVNPSPYSYTAMLEELRKKNEVPGVEEVPPVEDPRMAQMQNDIWRLNMQSLPQNTGGAQLNLYGDGVFDPKTGKQGQVSPEMSTARLQQVYATRPDLLWPGMNPNGTIQREFTGDRYDR